jgi:uroporphyrinogen decarboxylase
MEAYGRGATVDRLPTVPVLTNTTARVIGVKVSEFRNNGRLAAKGQVEAYKLFGYDVIRVMNDLFFPAEAMGAKIHYPDDETAYMEAPAIRSVSEIDSLRPADPYRDGQFPHILEAVKIVLDEVGSEVPVTAGVVCPFTNSSNLIGAESLARLVIKDPASVHKLCRLSLETCISYASAVMDLGATPSLTDAMSSGTIISRRQFAEFSLPYLKTLIDLIHSRGRKVTLHICGRTEMMWELMADAGADCISIDNDGDLALAKAKVGHRVRLMGNVRPSETMLQGTPQDVRRAVIECVKKAHGNPKGYIIASGCSLPTETPFGNIQAMLDTAREIGYPVDTAKLSRL